jgi:hypothetical protein
MLPLVLKPPVAWAKPEAVKLPVVTPPPVLTEEAVIG